VSRFYWACDLVGSKYSPTLRGDIEVRIYDIAWLEENGINRRTFDARVRRGWPIERALSSTT
jgi:hypothetical protein